MSHFSLKNISWKMVLNLILIIAILILIAQNLTSVALNIFTWRFDVPLFLLIRRPWDGSDSCLYNKNWRAMRR